jgi:Membrane protease subunits, stomatin/prohibitin homologs
MMNYTISEVKNMFAQILLFPTRIFWFWSSFSIVHRHFTFSRGVENGKIVPQSSVLLIERLGRFHRVAASGLNIIVPFFESPRSVYWTNVRPGTTSIDLREQFIDLPPQPVITRDNVTINVDSVGLLDDYRPDKMRL